MKVYTWDYKRTNDTKVTDLISSTYFTLKEVQEHVNNIGKQNRKTEIIVYEIVLKPIAIYKGSKKLLEKKRKK